MKLFVAGLSYKTAPVELREKLAVHASQLRCFGCRLKLAGNLSEVVLLSTCNRVEIYGVTPWTNGTVHRLFQVLSSGDVDFSPHLYIKEGGAAAQHLFSVASGLDSMVTAPWPSTAQLVVWAPTPLTTSTQASKSARISTPLTRSPSPMTRASPWQMAN